jgi:hypothetical protein
MKITIQAFSVKSIPKHIIDAIPNSIKRGKTLVAYVIGQEGESKPTALNIGKTLPLSWPAQAINRLAELAKGVRLFNRHQEGTNDNTGRAAMGEVVASYIDIVDGKRTAIAVAPFDARPSEDVCSIEADIVTEKTSAGFIVDSIKALTGIALGRAEEDTPAFAGARQLAAVQCFTPHQFTQRGEEHMVTFKEVEEFVKENKVWPSQLYDMRDVMKDNKFREDLSLRFVSPDDLKAVQEELKEARARLGEFEKKEGRTKGKDVLASKLKESTTDAQREWIMREWDKSNSLDFSDNGIEKFISDQTKEYEYIVKKFGEPNKPTKPDGKSDEEKLAEEMEAADGVNSLAAEILGG